MVTIQGWLDGEFQKWIQQIDGDFQEWFKGTTTNFKNTFASTSKTNKNWFVTNFRRKFFQWYSEYAEWFETYAVSCSRQKQPSYTST